MSIPAGGPSPLETVLDLRAAAVRIRSRYAHISNATEALLEALVDAAALLAALRETRAALRAGHDLLMASSDTQVDRSWAYWDARARAVLAQAVE